MNVKLDDQLFDDLLTQAQASPRQRSHYNLHQALDEPVQRLCIALIKGTYIQPHHHALKYKWELMVILKGELCLVIFDTMGKLIEKHRITAGNSMAGIEIPPNTWHTIYPLSNEAVMLEIKQGPYIPTKPEEFASWAPQEGETAVPDFLRWLEQAQPGESFI